MASADATGTKTIASAISGSSLLDFPTVKARLTGHRALVIDEDTESFGRIFVSLSSAGCRVKLARQPNVAMQITAVFRPGLIIFSTSLPAATVADLIAALRDAPATKDSVFIALAARESKRERHRMMDLGCDGYLWKPCDRYLFATELVRRTPCLLSDQPGSHGGLGGSATAPPFSF